MAAFDGQGCRRTAMELFMNRSHVATMIGVVVTALLASRIIALRAPRSASPGLLARLRFDIEWYLRGARSCIDDWIAASITRRERDAVIPTPHDRSERELSDMHLDCDCIDGCCSQQDCLARMTDRSVVRAPVENGR
jgi:hypothetical protein